MSNSIYKNDLWDYSDIFQNNSQKLVGAAVVFIVAAFILYRSGITIEYKSSTAVVTEEKKQVKILPAVKKDNKKETKQQEQSFKEEVSPQEIPAQIIFVQVPVITEKKSERIVLSGDVLPHEVAVPKTEQSYVQHKPALKPIPKYRAGSEFKNGYYCNFVLLTADCCSSTLTVWLSNSNAKVSVSVALNSPVYAANDYLNDWSCLRSGQKLSLYLKKVENDELVATAVFVQR